jgi:hypothetical protein
MQPKQQQGLELILASHSVTAIHDEFAAAVVRADCEVRRNRTGVVSLTHNGLNAAVFGF